MDSENAEAQVTEATGTPPVDETSTQSQPAEQPLTKADVEAMIEKVNRQWQRTSEQQRRALSSEAKDYRQRAELAESQNSFMEQVIKNDPRMSAQFRAAMTSAQAQQFRNREQSDRIEKDKAAFYNDIMSQVKDELGIEPDDKRMDWGMDAETPAEANRRILSSITKIQKEEQKTLEGRLRQQIKDEIAKARKDAGLDSVDKSSSGSGASQKGLANELSGGKNAAERMKLLDDFIHS